MGFDFGAFAGGVGQGISEGQDIREKYRKMVEEQQVRKANAIAAQVMAGGTLPKIGGGPAGGAPGGGGGVPAPAPMGAPPPQAAQQAPPPQMRAPQPSPPQQPQQVPMPGATPMPQQQRPPMALPPQMRQPMQRPMPQPAPRPAPQPAPRPAPQPQMRPPTPAPGGAAGAPPAGGQQDPNSPFAGLNIQQLGQQYQQLQQLAQQHYQQTMQSVVQQMKASGKKVDPIVAMDAADAIISKQGLDPTLKDLITANAGMARSQMTFVLGQQKDQTSRENTQDRVGAEERGQDIRSTTASNALSERIRNDDLVNATQNDRNAITLQGLQMTHEDRQDAIAAANQRASQATDSREKIASQQIAERLQAVDEAMQSGDYRALVGALSRQNAATIGTGGQATPLPTRGNANARAAAAAPAAPARQSAPPQAVQMLKSDPSPTKRRQFDQVFGQGAAAAALGQ